MDLEFFLSDNQKKLKLDDDIVLENALYVSTLITWYVLTTGFTFKKNSPTLNSAIRESASIQ